MLGSGTRPQTAVAAAGVAMMLCISGCTAKSPSATSSSGAGSSWRHTALLSDARDGHTATALTDGRVLVAGGWNGDEEALASTELFDPEAGSWTDVAPMTEARGNHTATLLPNGRVLVAGGKTGNLFGGALASAELYDPDSGTWSATGSLLEARGGHTATLLANGTVLVAGGSGADFAEVLASAELYDPDSGTWSAASPMTVPRMDFTATMLRSG